MNFTTGFIGGAIDQATGGWEVYATTVFVDFPALEAAETGEKTAEAREVKPPTEKACPQCKQTFPTADNFCPDDGSELATQ